VADWGQMLSMYNVQGRQLIKERPLGFDPMRLIQVVFNKESKYLVVVGSNRALAVYTLDGIRVAVLAEQQSWIWALAVRPNQPVVETPVHLVTKVLTSCQMVKRKLCTTLPHMSSTLIPAPHQRSRGGGWTGFKINRALLLIGSAGSWDGRWGGESL